MGELTGKSAIVTGAGRGLGRAYALRLASLGANVAVMDKSLRSWEEFEMEKERMTAGSTVEEIENMGGKALGFEFDVADRDAQDEMAKKVFDTWGSVDILVANAGGGSSTPATTRASELPSEDLDVVLKRNLYGTIFSVNAVAPYMKQQRSGKIVTVSSFAGSRGGEDGGYAHYGAAKAGIAMYTRYLAQDLGPYNINSNCIAPGLIATGRIMTNLRGGQTGYDHIPLRRPGTPEDLANLIEFLTTEASSYINGAVIPIDGGWNPGTA